MDFAELGRTLVPLGVAVILGGILGLERQIHGRWAGIRTHMTVAMASAMFVVAAGDLTKSAPAEMTRVIQGIAAGIGFLGAGTILKLSDQLEVKGLTTASSIWLSAALGTAAGLRRYELAVGGIIVAMVVLALLRPFEKGLDSDR